MSIAHEYVKGTETGTVTFTEVLNEFRADKGICVYQNDNTRSNNNAFDVKNPVAHFNQMMT